MTAASTSRSPSTVATFARPTAPAARTRLSSRCAWPAATLEEAAIFAAAATSQAVEHGLDAIGAGDGPVDVFNLTAAR